MSNRFSPSPAPLSVELRPSTHLRNALIGGGCAAGAAICHADLPWWLRGILLACAAFYLASTLQRQARLRGTLRWRDGGWSWRDCEGAEQSLRLREAVLWPGLIALDFVDAENGRRWPLTIVADSADADSLRRLRVCLRHLPVFGAAVDGPLS